MSGASGASAGIGGSAGTSGAAGGAGDGGAGDGGTSGVGGEAGAIEGGSAGIAGAGAGGSGGASGPDCQKPHGGRDLIGNIRVPANYPTIQQAIDGAQSGDTISVAAGTYLERIDFKGKAVRVASESGPELTIIDGQHVGPVVTFEKNEGRGSVLQGFTIRNGYGDGAGATLLLSSPTIYGNVFVDNAQSGGGSGAAIGGNIASPLVDSNLFRNNSCDTQFLSGVIAFINSSSPQIVNNVLIDNPCRGMNFTLPTGNAPVVSNNTLIGNYTGIYVDAQVVTQSQLYRNNLIVGGTIGWEVAFGSDANLPTWTNNLVFGNTTDFVGVADPTGKNGNLSVDPLLVNAAAGNFHLQAASPAIDAGSSAGSALPALDIDSDKRVLDGDGNGSPLVDLGAAEFVGSNDCHG